LFVLFQVGGPLPLRVLSLLAAACEPLSTLRHNVIEDPSGDLDLSPEMRLCHALFGLMLTCPVQALRQRAHRCFDAYLNTFHDAARCVWGGCSQSW
jgi:hypothetical protein